MSGVAKGSLDERVTEPPVKKRRGAGQKEYAREEEGLTRCSGYNRREDCHIIPCIRQRRTPKWRKPIQIGRAHV